MKYGVICAFDQEINYICQDLTDGKTTTVARRDYMEGRLYGKEVVLVMSRIGKVAAASTATTLIDRFGVDCVIFCGTAGGISKELNVGDVVVASGLVQHDFFTGSDYFRIPILDISEFPSDEKLSRAMEAGISTYLSAKVYEDIPKSLMEEFHIHAPKAAVGIIASGDQFINDKVKNQWLEENIKGIKCVEMEGAAVAQVCYEFGIPFAVIRVISDSANEESGIAFDKFAEEAMPYFTRGSLKAFFEAI